MHIECVWFIFSLTFHGPWKQYFITVEKKKCKKSVYTVLTSVYYCHTHVYFCETT